MDDAWISTSVSEFKIFAICTVSIMYKVRSYNALQGARADIMRDADGTLEERTTCPVLDIN